MNVTVLDLSLGNLHSLRTALEACGARVSIQTPAELRERPECLVLPGVGSFQAGAAGLDGAAQRVRGWLDDGLPALGICLGMQLLLESSEEGPGRGLGFVKGEVQALPASLAVRPHMGWARVRASADPIFEGIPAAAYFYFVHSYVPVPSEPAAIATTDAGAPIVAALHKKNTWATQFHPEKSGQVGLRLLRNFLQLAEAAR